MQTLFFWKNVHLMDFGSWNVSYVCVREKIVYLNIALTRQINYQTSLDHLCTMNCHVQEQQNNIPHTQRYCTVYPAWQIRPPLPPMTARELLALESLGRSEVLTVRAIESWDYDRSWDMRLNITNEIISK